MVVVEWVGYCSCRMGGCGSCRLGQVWQLQMDNVDQGGLITIRSQASGVCLGTHRTHRACGPTLHLIRSNQPSIPCPGGLLGPPWPYPLPWSILYILQLVNTGDIDTLMYWNQKNRALQGQDLISPFWGCQLTGCTNTSSTPTTERRWSIIDITYTSYLSHLA